jgi:hypothetical protein
MRMKLFLDKFNFHSVRAAVGAQLAACVVWASAHYNHGVPLAGVARSHGYRATCCAPTTALALLISIFFVPTTQAADLGRLFFTPEQRAQLDYSYAQDSGSGNNNRALMLNGIVQRHGGKRTVWINGVPQPAGSGDDKTPESQSVQVPGKTGSVKLKVGQRVLLDPAANPDTTRPDTPDTSKP